MEVCDPNVRGDRPLELVPVQQQPRADGGSELENLLGTGAVSAGRAQCCRGSLPPCVESRIQIEHHVGSRNCEYRGGAVCHEDLLPYCL